MPILKGFEFELLSDYSNAVFKPFYIHHESYCLVLDSLNIMNGTFVIRIPKSGCIFETLYSVCLIKPRVRFASVTFVFIWLVDCSKFE